jgi:excisionase family DNA binding protein
MPETRTYTTEELAQMTERNIEVIRRKIREKKIDAKKVGRAWEISDSEVYNIVKKNKRI